MPYDIELQQRAGSAFVPQSSELLSVVHVVPRGGARLEFQSFLFQMRNYENRDFTSEGNEIEEPSRRPAGKERDDQGSPQASYRTGCRTAAYDRAIGRPKRPGGKGKQAGNYNVQETIEFGYRLNEMSGNKDTYDTFVNLGSGVRLFDYTLNMSSLNHHGHFFDTLNFTNFGYGGDPNDVSRLHVDKNKWYDFDGLFRRDKNFWNYNLFANPLNPAAANPLGSQTTGCIVSPPSALHPGLPGFCSNPAVAQTNSTQAYDLVRRMQDYDVTLLPQSRVRFRLGFSHDRDEGPGFFTTDSGTVPDFPETYSYTTNAYHAGVDFRLLPRTTISYDQFFTDFKQDNTSWRARRRRRRTTAISWRTARR